MERYLLSKTNALRGVVLAEWRRAKRRGKAHGSVELILKQLRPKDLEDGNRLHSMKELNEIERNHKKFKDRMYN